LETLPHVEKNSELCIDLNIFVTLSTLGGAIYRNKRRRHTDHTWASGRYILYGEAKSWKGTRIFYVKNTKFQEQAQF